MKAVALIPARAGSLSIPDKNLVTGPLLGGKRLVEWTIEAANASKMLTYLILSTNDERTFMAYNGWGRTLAHLRDAALSGPTSPTEDTIKVFMEEHDPDVGVLLQLTSPLRTAKHIDAALLQMQREDADSIVSVTPEHGFHWWFEEGLAVSDYDPEMRPMRQQQKRLFKENGAIYAWTRDLWKRERVRCGGRVALYEMAPEASIEIDEPLDLDIAEVLLARAEGPVRGVRG